MRLLSELKIFNPALVYSFDPESSPKAIIFGEDFNEALYKMGQYEDMLDAYLYAEKVILPWIETNGLTALTPAIFENWILNIHKRIGKALLSMQEAQSGEYSKEMIVRWHHTTSMMHGLGMYMGKLFNPQPSESQFLDILVKENEGLNRSDAQQFLKIMQRLANDNKALIHSSLKKTMKLNGPLKNFTLALNRLATAWHEKLLSPEDRAVVEKIVLFVDYPENLPLQMREFSERMVAQWKTLSKDDLNAVSEFCTDLFYQFTHIHAFPNANGRTATALNNIILRSIGLPDILMRKPGERNASSGSYAEAMACIEKDRGPLGQHISACISEAQTQPFSDPILAKLIEIRIAMTGVSKQIKAIQPDYDLDQLTQIAITRNPLILKLDPLKTEHAVRTCQIILAVSQEKLTELTRKMENIKLVAASQSGLSFLKPTYDRTALHKRIEEMTGAEGWKIPNKEPLTIWRYCDSETEANALVKQLKQLDFCQANVRTTEGTGKKIVLCEKINVEKMFKTTEAQSTATTSLSSI